ncbi:arginine-tRNA-protein transferase [candidate division KSB1 bacterium]|nr:arginine-tRNA-protein transferase [candidate division KSB1 bacterium]RQW04636.1 MAG: arginine-tRNA-protein transferase [candidate division KSB1 bacterium]
MSSPDAIINEFSFQEKLSPAQMDAAWANGWRHFGSYFFRYSVIGNGADAKHVLPLRIRLADFQASTSQRRVWRRNRDLEVQIHDARIDDEKTALFDRHKIRFSDHVPDSLVSFLGEEPRHTPCCTKEICLYRDHLLIAVTFWDIGDAATSGIYALFEPTESRRSLGVYLILLSIHFSIQQQKNYYYIGYAHHEPSHYDYKKRFHALEYYDWNGAWLPFTKTP